MSDYQVKQQTKVGLWKVCLTAGLFTAALRMLVNHGKISLNLSEICGWFCSITVGCITFSIQYLG